MYLLYKYTSYIKKKEKKDVIKFNKDANNFFI